MKKVILALAVCATIASCQKKEDTDPIDVSKTTYLMNGRWQLKVSTWLPDIDDSTSFPVDVYTPLSSCEKDNYYKFNSLVRTTLHEGGSKCVITAPDSLVYGYTLSANDHHLEIYSNPDDSNHQIILSGDVTYPSIDTFVVTYTGRHPQDTAITSRYTKTYVKF